MILCLPFYPLFPLGEIVITTNAHTTLPPDEIADGLRRHAKGDWGAIPREDAEQNELGLEQGFRLFSAYGEGRHRFWIITESDRSVTTILLPEDY
jgi:hypothetical protein